MVAASMIYYSPVANVVVLVVLLAAMIEVDLHYVYIIKIEGKMGRLGGWGRGSWGREVGEGIREVKFGVEGKLILKCAED